MNLPPTCKYCKAYFQKYSCGANQGTGECDCPECQGYCECKEGFEDEQPEDDGYCYTCCGTGEGQFDGTRCQDCRGKGFTKFL